MTRTRSGHCFPSLPGRKMGEGEGVVGEGEGEGGDGYHTVVISCLEFEGRR